MCLGWFSLCFFLLDFFFYLLEYGYFILWDFGIISLTLSSTVFLPDFHSLLFLTCMLDDVVPPVPKTVLNFFSLSLLFFRSDHFYRSIFIFHWSFLCLLQFAVKLIKWNCSFSLLYVSVLGVLFFKQCQLYWHIITYHKIHPLNMYNSVIFIHRGVHLSLLSNFRTDTWLGNISSLSLGCIFTLLMVSFKKKRDFIYLFVCLFA